MTKEKLTKKDTERIRISRLGWLFLPLWITLVTLWGQTNFGHDALKTLDANSANFVVNIILLVPITLIASLLIYTTDFNLYNISEKSQKTSTLTRFLYTIILTSLTVFVSWYAFMAVNISI